MCVLRILDKIGVKDVTVVPEQSEPDGNFRPARIQTRNPRGAAEGPRALRDREARPAARNRPGLRPRGHRRQPERRIPSDDRQRGRHFASELHRPVQDGARNLPKGPGRRRPSSPPTWSTASRRITASRSAACLPASGTSATRSRFFEAEGPSQRYLLGFEESYGYLSRRLCPR